MEQLAAVYRSVGDSLQLLAFEQDCRQHAEKALAKMLGRLNYERLERTVRRLADLQVIMSE